jgi:tetratricopeptide (TPR) repeat protein
LGSALGRLAEKSGGTFTPAINALRKAVELAPRHVAALLALGDLYAQTENVEEAKAAYQQALLVSVAANDRPSAAQALLRSGHLCRVAGQVEEAESGLQQLYEMGEDNTYAQAAYELGMVEMQRKRFAPAIEHLNISAALSTAFGNLRAAAEANLQLGNAYTAQAKQLHRNDKDRTAALDSFKKAIQSYTQANSSFTALSWTEKINETRLRQEIQAALDSVDPTTLKTSDTEQVTPLNPSGNGASGNGATGNGDPALAVDPAPPEGGGTSEGGGTPEPPKALIDPDPNLPTVHNNQ